jgi:hypothetical protein
MHPGQNLTGKGEPHRRISCRGCCYWSNLIADNGGANGEIRAYCLAYGGPNYHEYTVASASCARHESGQSIDDPSLLVT